MTAASDRVERLEARLAEVRRSREGAEAAEKWTAVSTLSAAEDKLLTALLEAQAEQAEQADRAGDELTADALLDRIEGLVRQLPSYLVDELLERLEACRETTPASDWVPS